MPPMKRPAKSDRASDFSASYSLHQLARRWQLSRREVRQLLQRGKLPFQQICGKIRVPYQAVLAFEQNSPVHSA